MKKIANKNALEYVKRRDIFQGSHMFSELRCSNGTIRYGVFSYGLHFPMLIAEWRPDTPDNISWYENKDRFSQSTTRHQSQVRQYDVPTLAMGTRAMCALWQGGITEVLTLSENYAS